MRILAAGDHHFDADRRFDECVRIHEWTVDVARRERVDAFLSGGDIYERASAATEREAVAEWLTRMAEVCPVIIARGNHDRDKDVELMRRLKTRHPIVVETAASVHRVGGVAVGAFAWPDRGQLAATVGARMAGEALDTAAQECFRAVLLGLAEEFDEHPGLPRLLLGHAMIDGSVVSTGQPLLGMPLNLGLQDLSLARADIGIFSHIHKAQERIYDGVPYLYAGSLHRTDFGQLEEKSVVLATFEQGRCNFERIATPATKMIHVSDEWGTCDLWDGPGWLVGDGNPDEWRGAELRFRYRVANDQRNAAAAAAEQKKAEMLDRYGAVSVQVEESVIPTTRARAPEIALATTLADKLDALRASRGETLEPERLRGLGEKLSLLEQEHADAA